MKAPDVVPEHLTPFVVDQKYENYTPMDQATWRFIMRVSREFFKTHAHRKYLDGLEQTGISIERIPRIAEMDQKLKRFGWRAVGVSGFIPPAAFMEFQSLGFLPIACDMRTLEHLAYTPAPDIVHEAAGHAPIIADPEYAKYLRAYGEVARKAIFSHHDMKMYEAIRILSEVKENPQSTETEIKSAQDRLDLAVSGIDYVSEATYLARMNWWTVEYGLIQSGQDPEPLIYGAGLLSSVGESHSCLKPQVQKIPLTLDCINMAYDITRPQPRLFVVSSFDALTQALEQFSKTMAYKLGGVAGLAKAKTAQTVTTVVLDTGIQISGILADFRLDRHAQPAYIHMQGPTQLSFDHRELPDQGCSVHAQGFGSPVGKVVSQSDRKMVFESGVVVEGQRFETVSKNGIPILHRWKDCTVTLGETILYQPAWGMYDMAVGMHVTSVFGGSADRPAYLKATAPPLAARNVQKTNLTAANSDLCEWYTRVRKMREAGSKENTALMELFDSASHHPSGDWLLALEIYELTGSEKVLGYLREFSDRHPETSDLITTGLRLAQA